MIFVLVGPKGSGKSFIGQTIQKSLGIVLIPVDQIWLTLKNERNDYGSLEFREAGFKLMYSQAQSVLKSNDSICIESTGVGAQKQDFIKSLSALGRLFLVKIIASEKTCLQRIHTRDNSCHIPKDDVQINDINRQSIALQMKWDLVLDNNQPLGADKIVAIFRRIA